MNFESNIPSSGTKHMSKGLNIINTMKNKIPAFILFVHLSIVSHVYKTCDDGDEAIFWIYYPILSLICIIWEFFYVYFNLKSQYTNLVKNDYIFCVVSSIISLWSFIVTSYYLQDGKPFTCYFSYNKDVATVVLYLSYAIIFGFSILEKFCFRRELNNF